jgi:hypothetical protein
MEVVTGCTLSTWLANQGQLGAREAALVGLDLCRALAAVHRAGLVHGDVKARNVMRAAGGRTVLMDFGTGKDLHAARPATDAVSDLAGTPLYLAPEVFAGASRTTSTDIYSLGVLLFHLVTTKYPVDGATELEVEQTHQRGARTRLRDARPDLPDGFVHTIERAISVDPGERYRTAGEFEADLAAFLGQRGDRPASPFRSMWLAAALLAIVLAGGTSTTLLRWRNVPAIRGTASPVPADRTAATAASSYAIDTGFYTERERQETRLRFGDRVAPGDTLYAKLRVSVPAYVYIVNEDDRGESYLLFPLPGQSVRNPLPANSTIRIPGTRDDNRVSWKITSAGGREHFLVFASPDRLQEFEDMFAALPHAEFDKPVQTAKLPAQTLGRLRGVGGLAADHAAAPARLAGLFTRPLADGEETAQGVWVRQLTLDNPAPR